MHVKIDARQGANDGRAHAVFTRQPTGFEKPAGIVGGVHAVNIFRRPPAVKARGLTRLWRIVEIGAVATPRVVGQVANLPWQTQ